VVVIVAGPTSSDIEMSSNAASLPLPPTVSKSIIFLRCRHLLSFSFLSLCWNYNVVTHSCCLWC
jgi:hypothetical protein